MGNCQKCQSAPLGKACSVEHAELVRAYLDDLLTAGRGEAEDGPDSTGEPSRRASSVRLHLEKALECLTDEFNVGRAGASGLRAEAITHVRLALMRAVMLGE